MSKIPMTVVVYGRAACSSCLEMKEWLKARGVEFTAHNAFDKDFDSDWRTPGFTDAVAAYYAVDPQDQELPIVSVNGSFMQAADACIVIDAILREATPESPRQTPAPEYQTQPAGCPMAETMLQPALA